MGAKRVSGPSWSHSRRVCSDAPYVRWLHRVFGGCCVRAEFLHNRREHFEQNRMTPGKLCAAARGRSPKGCGAERSRRQPRSVNSARSAYFPCEAPVGCVAGDSERIVFYILFIVYMGAKNDPHAGNPGTGKNHHKSLNSNDRNTQVDVPQ